MDTSEAACHNEDYGGTRLDLQLAILRATSNPTVGTACGVEPPCLDGANSMNQGGEPPFSTSRWAVVSVGEAAQVVLPPTGSGASVAAAVAGLRPKGDACTFLAGMKLAKVCIHA